MGADSFHTPIVLPTRVVPVGDGSFAVSVATRAQEQSIYTGLAHAAECAYPASGTPDWADAYTHEAMFQGKSWGCYWDGRLDAVEGGDPRS